MPARLGVSSGGADAVHDSGSGGSGDDGGGARW